MKILCELFRNMSNNMSRIHGTCYNPANTSQITLKDPKKSNQGLLAHNLKTNFEKSEFYHHNHHNPKQTNANVSSAGGQSDEQGAAMFIIVVICFYSLSILFLVIFNIKCNLVLNRKSAGRCSCCASKQHDLYESQKDETKTTIHMIFNDSSRLLTSVAIPSNLVNTIEFNNSVFETSRSDSKLSTKSVGRDETSTEIEHE